MERSGNSLWQLSVVVAVGLYLATAFQSACLAKDYWQLILNASGKRASIVNDADVDSIHDLGITTLILDEKFVSAKTLRKAALKFPRITTIDLWETSISDQDLALLKGFKNLEYLNVHRIGNTGVKNIALLQGLKGLRLESGARELDLDPLGKLSNLRQLDLCYCIGGAVDPDARIMRFLGRLPRLETLAIENERLTKSTLQYIGKLRSLTCLELDRCELPKEALHYLGGLSSLREFYLAGPMPLSFDSSDVASFKFLLSLPKLQKLGLEWRGINDDALVNLRLLKNLVSLDLTGNRIAGYGLASLARLPIRKLDLSYNKSLDGKNLRYLSGLPNLIELNLICSPLTDQGFEILVANTHLKMLNIGGTGVTKGSLEKLKKMSGLLRVSVPIDDSDPYVSSLQRELPNVVISGEHAQFLPPNCIIDHTQY